MIDYLYDGTFEGLLTCVYHHYYTEKAAGIYPREDYQPSLLNGFMEVETEEDKADRVYNAIGSKISSYALRLVSVRNAEFYHAYREKLLHLCDQYSSSRLRPATNESRCRVDGFPYNCNGFTYQRRRLYCSNSFGDRNWRFWHDSYLY